MMVLAPLIYATNKVHNTKPIAYDKDRECIAVFISEVLDFILYSPFTKLD